MRSDRNRTLAAVVVSVVALVVILVTVWPRGDEPLTEAQRADHIASRLRCPFCSGESIADATSQVARDLEVVIQEQVAAGMTDDEIFDFFEARYGEALLLDPPLLGWGLALWALPLAALVGGLLVVARRRRSPDSTTANVPAALVEDRLEAVARDRADIEEQLSGGELEPQQAGSLLTILDDEEARLRAAVEGDDSSGDEGQAGAWWSRRAVAGVAVVAVGAVAVVLTLATTSDPGEDRGIIDAPPVDLSNVTVDQLEAVVAANPDVTGMRLALAKTLAAQGELLRAAEHFNEVLQRENNPEALAWLGWISYLAASGSEDPALVAEIAPTAEAYLVDALAIVPDYPQAQWWLAMVRFDLLGDAAGAIEPLRAVLNADGVPEDIRAAAEQMLSLAGESS